MQLPAGGAAIQKQGGSRDEERPVGSARVNVIGGACQVFDRQPSSASGGATDRNEIRSLANQRRPTALGAKRPSRLRAALEAKCRRQGPGSAYPESSPGVHRFQRDPCCPANLRNEVGQRISVDDTSDAVRANVHCRALGRQPGFCVVFVVSGIGPFGRNDPVLFPTWCFGMRM
jgi:hypothetical protein